MNKAFELGLYEKSMPGTLSWREKMTAAKQAGFDYLEISIDETDDKLARLQMSRQERLALVAAGTECGLPIRTMCLSGHRKYPLGSADAATCARGIEIMEQAIALASDLGVRIIQLAGYDVYYEQSTPETVARFAENLKKSTDLAARAGVLLGFETMETEFMNTVGKAMEYVRLVNSPYLQVYPDAGNLTNASVLYQSDLLEDVRAGAGHLAAMHLKETTPGVFREVPYGTGHVNFPAIVQAAWEIGVRKFTAEFWYTGNSAWKEDLAFAAKLLGDVLQKQAVK